MKLNWGRTNKAERQREDEAEGWFKDLQHRPGERDLLKAEIFLEEILEELGGD